MNIAAMMTRRCEEAHIDLPVGAGERFEAYYHYLVEMNRVMDLTAVEGGMETVERHFLDSLSLLPLLPAGAQRVIDIGSGAGFPGLPLKLARPELSLTLLDAQQKRVDFLSALCDRLGTAVTCIHARAEEQALLPGWRDGFQVCVSRAVARLDQLTELCLPFVQVGGLFLAMKSRDCEEETAEAAAAIRILGGGEAELLPLTAGGIQRAAVRVVKAAPTPEGYPRRFARIQKKPLR